MKNGSAIISGLAGAVALTLLHQLLKHSVSSAPAMDKMGEQGLTKLLDAGGIAIPDSETVHNMALAGDIVGNAGYYSLVGFKPQYALYTGAALGMVAGLGALKVPDQVGLNPQYSNATIKTKALTVLIYLAGGVVAGAVQSYLHRKKALLF